MCKKLQTNSIHQLIRNTPVCILKKAFLTYTLTLLVPLSGVIAKSIKKTSKRNDIAKLKSGGNIGQYLASFARCLRNAKETSLTPA